MRDRSRRRRRKIIKSRSRSELWDANGKSAMFMRKLTPLLAKSKEPVYYLAQKLSQRNGRKAGARRDGRCSVRSFSACNVSSDLQAR